MEFKILDLFAGAGGFSYGFEMNNHFKTVLANDYNSDALDTFKHNHKHANIIIGDITMPDIKKQIIKESKDLGVNMIIGGPPCQGFSMKGKKLGLNDPRNFLFLEYVDIVKHIRPKVFVLENVKSMISSADGYFIKSAVDEFKKLGYYVNYGVLNSRNFGIPQKRERAFIIGSLSSDILLPKGNSKEVSIHDAISDLSYLESGESSDKYLHAPKSSYQKIMRKKSSTLQWHSATRHSDLAIKKMKLIPEKGNKFDLPVHLRTKQKFNTTWSRLIWNDVSPTIDTRFDTPSNGQNIHPILHRAITPREAARIQSFPDTFHFHGKKTQVCKQIGNAVPPLLAKAIANKIYKSFENNDPLYIDKSIIYNNDSYHFDLKNIPTLDAIITDPPYNISKTNNFSTLKGKRKGVDFGDWDKEFDLYSWIDIYYPKLKPGGSIIIFGSYLYISHICDRLTAQGALVKDLIKWTKTNPMPRNIERRYVQDTEFAIWAVKPGKWTFNKGNHKYRRAQYSSSTVSGKERTEHPTQKSLKLMNEIILTHTNSGDLILDPFMGSGTTGVSAEINGRKFIGIEKDKKYFEIAIDRIQKRE